MTCIYGWPFYLMSGADSGQPTRGRMFNRMCCRYNLVQQYLNMFSICGCWLSVCLVLLIFQLFENGLFEKTVPGPLCKDDMHKLRNGPNFYFKKQKQKLYLEKSEVWKNCTLKKFVFKWDAKRALRVRAPQSTSTLCYPVSIELLIMPPTQCCLQFLSLVKCW